MTTESTTPQGRNLPDFWVYASESYTQGKTVKNRRILVGSIRRHKSGDGLGIYLDSLPIRNFDGSLVAFAPNSQNDAEAPESM